MLKAIYQRFTLYLIFLSLSLNSHSHEFWINPSTFVGEPGMVVDLELLVGQKFRGIAMPFIPADINRFELVNENSVKTINGVMGDSTPAAQITLSSGLNRVIHLTTPTEIRFSDKDERWSDYVEGDGLQRQLSQYPDLPQVVPVSERYIRSVKSLITTKTTKDSLSQRLPFELVVDSTLPLRPGFHIIQLLEGGEPVRDVLIKAFRYSDRSITDSSYTDQKGLVVLKLPTANQYLISGVVIRPDDSPDHDWISYWSAITLEVLN